MQQSIEGPITYTRETVAQSLAWYQGEMREAGRICEAIVGRVLPRDDLSMTRRIGFLRGQLSIRDYSWDSHEEAQLRGTLLEIVSQQALDAIAQRAQPDSPYRVIFAPPAIFDDSTREKKGGDLLLIEQVKRGSYKGICVIDVTAHAKKPSELRTATNDGLGEEYILPVIIVKLGEIEWVDFAGKSRPTNKHIRSTVRRMFRANITQLPFYGSHPDSTEQVLAAMKCRTEAGCRRSSEQIRTMRRGPKTQQLLAKLQITNTILGIGQQ